jgi:hypothetical protein
MANRMNFYDLQYMFVSGSPSAWASLAANVNSKTVLIKYAIKTDEIHQHCRRPNV